MSTIFDIYRTVITEAHRNFVKNHFTYNPDRSIRVYRERFFKNNPNATEKDFSSWMTHHMCNNWEDDILWMDDNQFKYHWPSHYSFIMEIHSEEDQNNIVGEV